VKHRRLATAGLLLLAGCETSHTVSEVGRAVGFGGPAGEKGWQPDAPGQSSQTSRSSSDIKPKKTAE
jgi:hypothetical protein